MSIPDVQLLDQVAEKLAARFEVHVREAWTVDDVHLVTGLGRATILRWAETGENEFPPKRKRGKRAFWLAAEVRNWIKKSPRVA